MVFKSVIFVVLYITVTFLYHYEPMFYVYETALLLMWQILHSMESGGKGGLSLNLIVIIFLSRVLIFYSMIVEESIFRIEQPS
jgi:hypothetical protein